MVRKSKRSVKWLIQDRNIILGVWLREDTLVYGGPFSQRNSHTVILSKLVGLPAGLSHKTYCSGGRYRVICTLPDELILAGIIRDLDYYGKRVDSFRRLMH